MHKPATEPGRLGGDDAHAVGVDLPGTRGLRLGLVHGGVGGGVDHDVGRLTAEQCLHGVRAFQIGLVAAERHQPPQRRQHLLEFAAHLAASAEQDDFHGADPGDAYCVSIHSR